jgi:uncharacterized repeat protein (TIGR03803 family)
MKNTFILLMTGAALTLTAGLMESANAAPGDCRTLIEFTSASTHGGRPLTPPILSGNLLFGMTPYGGVSNRGVVYKVDLATTNFSLLHSFTGPNGRNPLGLLLQYGTNLYGMTTLGGTNDAGVVFRIGTNGAGYTVLHHFDGANENDGATPWGALAESGGVLYGTTYNGGITNRGVVFSINPDGSGYVNLHRFLGGAGDGKHPKAGLLIDGGKLYGTTSEGGFNNAGVVFSMALNGSGYTNLCEFTGQAGNGMNPSAGLIKKGSYLFGTLHGVQTTAGSTFCVHTNGGTVNFMWFFTGTATDGADPFSALVEHDTKVYGVTRYGGSNSAGTVYSLGAWKTNQYMWPEGAGEPIGGLIAAGDVFYGTTLRGGVSNNGTLFRLEMNTNDGPIAYSAIQWIDDGGMGTTLAGDENPRNMYVQHNTDAGEPDTALIGYGRTQDLDDGSWHWTTMVRRASLVGGNYEYTGRLSRASANAYHVAAKFIKGAHVYYPPAGSGWNSWGNWDTALWTTNTWIVLALTPPSNVYARFMTTNRIDVNFSPDGTHWVTMFRKTGSAADFVAPADGTTYYVGDTSTNQGECIYRGDVSPFANTNLPIDSIYSYRLYTENFAYYSTGIYASASTYTSRDDDGDQMPNQFEVGYGLNPGLASDGLGDLDNDQFLNWQEYIAGTDLTNEESLLWISAIQTATTNCTLRWLSVDGKQYTIHRSTNIMNSFSAIVSNVTAMAPTNTWSESLPGSTNFFYRVEVQR